MASKQSVNVIGEALLKYWQLLMAFVFIIVGWTLFESRLGAASLEIKELKTKVSQQEERYQEFQRESLQRLSSIEAKVDFLVNNTSTRSEKPTEQSKITTANFPSCDYSAVEPQIKRVYNSKAIKISNIREAKEIKSLKELSKF